VAGRSIGTGSVGTSVRQAVAMITLSRPQACLCAGAEVLAGTQLSRHPPPWATVGLTATREGIAVTLITAAVNVFNDIRDVKADTISAPWRVLPRGRLAVSTAWLLACGQAGLALILSATVPLGPPVAVLLLAIGVCYSCALKGIPLIGNLVVGALASAPLVYGAYLAHDDLAAACYAALIGLSYMFAYEVLKTVRDVSADKAVGCRTVATLWGVCVTARVYRAALSCYACLAVAPVIFTRVSIYYTVIMITGGVVPPLIAGWLLPADPSRKAVRRTLKLMGYAWIPGLFAFALALRS
jgi:geranylgeranylglycerol-phosphate geranylgeranyltransferase